MSTDRDTTRIVRSWLRRDENDSADRVLGAVLDRLDATPQRPMTRWSARRLLTMDSGQRTAVAAAAVALAILGLSYFAMARVGAPVTTESPSASSETSAAAFPSLPVLRLPPTRPNAGAGEFGWEGVPGDPIAGMHRVVGAREATALLFATGPDCFQDQAGREPSQVSVAGMHGISIDRYGPPVPFNNDGDEITRAYALDVHGRTLCVFVTWHPATSEAQLRAALDILDTIKAQPIGTDGVRITFTLPAGWDTG